MRIDVKHRCSDFDSYRAARVKSLFNAENGCNWEKSVDLPIEGMDWKIGLIVGASGTGKTSIGSRIFNEPIYDLYEGWKNDRPIVDCINPTGDFNAVTGTLSAVGLGDVPAWLRPFNVLSNGEKFRAGLARLVCERPERAVVDEFTSVIDRQIAKVGAAAFAKTWRKGSGQVVLLSCHYDIIEWLQPDWVYDTNEARFYDRDCLRQRPSLELQIYKVSGSVFRHFKPHYYLDLPLPVAAEYFVGVIGNEPVCHLAVCPLFTAKAYRATRLVVMPEWQGIGVGTKFLNAICDYHLEGRGRCGYKYPVFFHTSHPQLCGALRYSKKWKQTAARLYGENKARSSASMKRAYEKKEQRIDVQPVTEVILEPYRPLSILEGNMVVKILGDRNTPAYEAAKGLVKKLGHVICSDRRPCADIAIAPLLTRILPEEELNDPFFGTLIFHPSPLPFGRGASAIKHAYKRNDAITAATWFWADGGIDSGDICEQEIIKINYDLRPRDFYTNDVLPAMLRTLERALMSLSRGTVRKVPQVEKYSSYDARI